MSQVREEFGKLRPSEYTFHIKKFFTIQYLLLARYVGKNNAQSDSHLDELIKETGFVKLAELK